MDTIKERRAKGNDESEHDMMKHLMNSTYKNGIRVPDHEVAHMMIALLMAGQHSSSSTSSWIMLRLAQYPHIMEELYQEQVKNLGADLPPLAYEDLAKLPLNQAIVKETLRLHAPIHSIMRAVKSPMPVPGTKYVIPTSHTLLAAPGVSATDSAFFPNPDEWDPHRWEADSPNFPAWLPRARTRRRSTTVTVLSARAQLLPTCLSALAVTDVLVSILPTPSCKPLLPRLFVSSSSATLMAVTP
ncbi:hypothetical protein NXS19_001234 [Fusarium pseudograminearum]|nr:hypothetical protein NXS19_001234 [Fusarium pseudograminearum]